MMKIYIANFLVLPMGLQVMTSPHTWLLVVTVVYASTVQLYRMSVPDPSLAVHVNS